VGVCTHVNVRECVGVCTWERVREVKVSERVKVSVRVYESG
jgi:hypothetical protein